MGLFSNNNNQKNEMIQIARMHAKLYVTNNPDWDNEMIEFAGELFASVISFVDAISVKDINRELRKPFVNTESITLNIVQNSSLFYIKENQSIEKYLMGIDEKTNVAKSVYEYANDVKLQKGYITKKQYDENDRLAQAVLIGAPVSLI